MIGALLGAPEAVLGQKRAILGQNQAKISAEMVIFTGHKKTPVFSGTIFCCFFGVFALHASGCGGRDGGRGQPDGAKTTKHKNRVS